MCRQGVGLDGVVMQIRQNAIFGRRVQACAIPMARTTRIPVQRADDGRILLEECRLGACQMSYVVRACLFRTRDINTCQCYAPDVLTVRRAGNNGRVAMVRRKAASFLPPHRRLIPHPLGFGKYVANSRIDCCDDGARGERPNGDKTRIAITQRKSMLGAPTGQSDSCNRKG